MVNPPRGLISWFTHTETRRFVRYDTRRQVFRPNEDVDINVLSDGSYIVGYVAPGEYLRYTVTVTKKGM